MRPTLREIAQAAGVSKMTVSLALRGVPRIPAATRERIREVASGLGYQPDATFNLLMAHIRSKAPAKSAATLAVASFEPRRKEDEERLCGIEEQAARRGYGVDFVTLLESQHTPERVLKIFQARGIQGIILHAVPSPFLPPAFRGLYENFPAVVVGMKPRMPALHFVSEDAYATARLAFGQALKAGYRRLGILLNSFYDQLQERRFLASFLVEQLVLPPEDRLPFLDFSDPGSRLHQFEAWCAEHRPDCIISGFETRADLQSVGIQIPPGLGYIALQRELDPPGIARIDPNHARIGAAAVDLLVSLIHAGETGVPLVQCSTLIEGTWVPGVSLPARRAGRPGGHAHPSWQPADPSCEGPEEAGGGLPVDLRAVVNRPLASFAGYDAPLLCLEPGHQKIHGVRFEILDEAATGAAAIALNGCRHSHPSLTAAAAVRLRFERHAARVCFLHSCVHAHEHGVIAHYHFGYEDGSRATAEVIAHGVGAYSGAAADRRARDSNVQDWWPDYVQFENGQARQAVITSPDEPDLYKRFLYTFQWRNPHPERLIRTLRIVAAPDSPATLIVLAITTVNDPAGVV